MPGNSPLFEQAMAVGDNAAWDHDWKTAISAYARAVQESPGEPRGYNSLGMVLLEVQRFADALKIYARARALDPDNPLPIEKSADILERLGRNQEAAQNYADAADLYLAQQRDLDKAIENWQRATRLTPGLMQVHVRLAQSYERIGHKEDAIREFLMLAYNFRSTGDTQRALQSIDRALRLDPMNGQALNARRAMETGGDVQLPSEFNLQSTAPAPIRRGGFEIDDLSLDRVKSTDIRGPLGEAVDLAMADLAGFVLDDNLSQATSHAIEGIELQRAGEVETAIAAYRAARSGGVQHRALAVCLGALYIAQSTWAEAVSELAKVIDTPLYPAGVAHGLSIAYHGMGQEQESSQMLIKALRLTDLSLASGEDDPTLLESQYESLAARIAQFEPGDVADVNHNLITWLSGPNWKTRIPERRRLLFTFPDEDLNDLLRFGSDKIEQVALLSEAIERYIGQRLYVLAIEEAQHAIELVPGYLPAHMRIAEALQAQGHTTEAVVKYNLVADTFLARNESRRAATILNAVIALAPMDVNLRTSLIELLEQEQQWPEAVDQYIELAKAYRQLADVTQARSTYQAALRLAQRIGSPAKKRSEIMRHIAEIDQNRLDWRQALRTYEQIRQIDPNDEVVREELVALNYRLNNPQEAIRELDGLLRVYAQNRDGNKIIAMLEKLVEQQPSDMALRSRLIAVYRQTRRIPEAVAQLDTLGELQLQAGMVQEACATIRQILTIQPEGGAQYRQLLTQLGC